MNDETNLMSERTDPSIAPVPRYLARKSRVSPPSPGFAGPGHTVVEVFSSASLAESNPFVLLMDDRLDFEPGQPIGEPHPHAGLETVTLVIEGALDTGSEGLLETGDAAWMNAGRGLVHSEHVVALGRARVLQLWIALPKAERGSEPDLQIIRHDDAPVRKERGVEARLYSGRTGSLRSPTRNRAPVTMVDFVLAPNASITQQLPGSYSGFMLVLEGSLTVQGTRLEESDVGWLEPTTSSTTSLDVRAGAAGARALLYAGEPQAGPIVQRGPFVAGSEAEIAAYYKAYRAGTFARLADLSHGAPAQGARS